MDLGSLDEGGQLVSRLCKNSISPKLYQVKLIPWFSKTVSFILHLRLPHLLFLQSGLTTSFSPGQHVRSRRLSHLSVKSIYLTNLMYQARAAAAAASWPPSTYIILALSLIETHRRGVEISLSKKMQGVEKKIQFSYCTSRHHWLRFSTAKIGVG